jgi:ABC-type lipoprotein release transport system permease subunit
VSIDTLNLIMVAIIAVAAFTIGYALRSLVSRRRHRKAKRRWRL